jgi:hypothetical protein
MLVLAVIVHMLKYAQMDGYPPLGEVLPLQKVLGIDAAGGTQFDQMHRHSFSGHGHQALPGRRGPNTGHDDSSPHSST